MDHTSPVQYLRRVRRYNNISGDGETARVVIRLSVIFQTGGRMLRIGRIVAHAGVRLRGRKSTHEYCRPAPGRRYWRSREFERLAGAGKVPRAIVQGYSGATWAPGAAH